MKWEYLNKNDLQQFIDSPAFEKLPVLPISRHRAVSQINNPRAAEDDTLLILIWADAHLCAYAGIVPDIFYRNEEPVKVGWMSSIWVSPEMRGQKLSRKLIETSIGLYKEKIVLTEFTPEAGWLYKYYGLSTFARNTGVRSYIRSDLSFLLPPKHPIFEKCKGLLNILDRAINAFADQRLSIGHSKYAGKNTVEFRNAIDPQTDEFIQQHQHTLPMRGKEELNWIMEHPWILNKPPDEDSRKYIFSSVATDFQYTPIWLVDEYGGIKAFIILSKREQHLKVPYAFFDDDATTQVLKLIYHYIRLWHISICTFFHPRLVEAANMKKGPALFKKEFKREYLSTAHLKNMFPILPHTPFQDGDGDTAFT